MYEHPNLLGVESLHTLCGLISIMYMLLNGRIKNLQLFKSDQDVLIHGKELTDALIDAAQNLLRKNYPRINGLQPPSLAPLLQFNPTPTRAVQIHHTGKSA